MKTSYFLLLFIFLSNIGFSQFNFKFKFEDPNGGLITQTTDYQYPGISNLTVINVDLSQSVCAGDNIDLVNYSSGSYDGYSINQNTLWDAKWGNWNNQTIPTWNTTSSLPFNNAIWPYSNTINITIPINPPAGNVYMNSGNDNNFSYFHLLVAPEGLGGHYNGVYNSNAGCQRILVLKLKVKKAPSCIEDQVICADEQLSNDLLGIDPTTTTASNWSPSDPRVDPLVNGTYSVTLSNGTCISECSFEVELIAPYQDLILDEGICAEDLPYLSEDISATYPFSISVNTVTVFDDYFITDASYFDQSGSYLQFTDPGNYEIELEYYYFDDNNIQQTCTKTYDLSIQPALNHNLPSTYVSCDGVFEEICAPYDESYSYQWYGPLYEPTTSYLLGEEQCFTPSQYGIHTLLITDEYGCVTSHRFSVLEELPMPILAIGNEICIGDIITIDGQGFDNPDFTISWYHNNTLVQTGGTTLQTSFVSGIITVEISFENCEIVTTSATLKECCPDELFLIVDCETQTILIENIPSSIAGAGITAWTFNGDHITPQSLFSTSFNTTLGDGTYGVTILFELDNGEKCEYYESIEFKSANCCEETGPIANAHFVNIEDFQTTYTDPWGEVEIPILCDFILDASGSLCENEYTLSIAELDPLTWTTTEYYPWTYFSGEAGNSIDLGQLTTFEPGQTYLLALNVGPNGTSVYLPFIYGLDAEVSILNSSGTILVNDTKYGDFEVPIVNCRLDLDGSASTCEDSYQITIDAFDPYTWSTVSPGTLYQQWFNTQAPNSITISANDLQGYTGFCLLTFAVGPIWTPEYKLFWFDCDTKSDSNNIGNRSTININSEDITVYPNPTSDLVNIELAFDKGTYQLIDVSGKVHLQDVISSKNTKIDLSEMNQGVYFIKIQSQDNCTHFKKIIKN